MDASYERDPFGRPVKSEGTYASDNPFRFSTKYTDDETGLVYYGYRYYDAELGRWSSRDPVEEDGGLNLYAFIKNSSMNSYDFVGLEPIGHHKVPQEIWKDIVSDEVKSVWDGIDGRLSDSNYNYHNGKTLQGVTHPEYNKAVINELKEYMEKKGICCVEDLKRVHAQEFLQHLDMLDDNHVIKKYNKGVLEEIEQAKLFGKKTWSRFSGGRTGKSVLVKLRIAEAAETAAKVLNKIPGLKYGVIVAGVVIAWKDAQATGWSRPMSVAFVAVDTISPVGAVLSPMEINGMVEWTEEQVDPVMNQFFDYRTMLNFCQGPYGW